MKKYTLIATAPMGIEAVVAKEVRDLGYECKVDNGKVIFEGDALAICRANLWLRTADRIKVQVASFKAKTFDELFEKTKAINWRSFIPENGKFPVIGKSVKSTLASVPDCQPLKTALAYDFARHEHYGHLSTVRAWTFLYRFKICSDYPNVKNMNYYITTDYNLQAPFFSSVINHKACCQKRVFLS